VRGEIVVLLDLKREGDELQEAVTKVRDRL